MSEHFPFDIFLSYSAQDKDVVRALAEILRSDGFRVWFDEWEIRPGDHIPSRIESGLDESRVLVLCVSANAFRSDWIALESQTFRFRDPLNRERRFVPLRLDQTPVTRSLAQFRYVEWLEGGQRSVNSREYAKLRDACRIPIDALAPQKGPVKTNVKTSNQLPEEATGQMTAPSVQPKWDVFLSYNSKDRLAVMEIGLTLKKRGFNVWLDVWELRPGRPWQEAIEEIINQTRSAAVLVGPSGFGPWEVPEMRGLLSEFVNRKLAIMPVLLPGTPETPKLPLFLAQFTWVDLRGGLNEEGFSRLCWGITGAKPASIA